MNQIAQQGAKITDWMPVYEILPWLEEGDLVEIKREFYNHWAVFIRQEQNGDGIFYVVHLSTPSGSDKNALSIFNSSSSSTPGDDPIVQYSDIMLVVGLSRCRINNSQDVDCHPFPPHEIVNRALTECEKSKRYNVITNNCEHFVTWCRYGTKISSQSSLAKSVAVGAVAGIVTGSGLAGVAACTACYVVCKKASKTWNRLARHRFIPY